MQERDLYWLQQDFPKKGIYAPGEQIKRSASSATSNIAEGSGRNSYKEKVHFIEIAYGLLMEDFSQLQIVHDLGFLSEQDIDVIRPPFIGVVKMRLGRKNYIEKKIGVIQYGQRNDNKHHNKEHEWFW